MEAAVAGRWASVSRLTCAVAVAVSEGRPRYIKGTEHFDLLPSFSDSVPNLRYTVEVNMSKNIVHFFLD